MLLVHRPEGLYCEAGDFFVDPWRPVARAVITHAHADHARAGHGAYLAAAPAEGVIHLRSASRLGREDLGTNRRRIEAIRAACGERREEAAHE